MPLRSWLRRGIVPLAVAAALAATVATVSVAQADDTPVIGIDGGRLPTTAKQFATNDCGMVPPSIGEHEDGWVFVLPNSKWRFASVTASFTDAKGAEHSVDATPTKPPHGTASSKYYVITPAGWTLSGASAEVEPKVERPGAQPQSFDLLNTCPGTPKEPEPDPSTATPSSPQPSSSGSSEPSATPSGSASPDDSGLPVTGRSLTLPLLAGLGLAAAGVLILILARRRTAPTVPTDPAD